MRAQLFLVALIAIVSGTSFHCGITQPVRVLDEGKTQLSGSLGGPFIPLGATTVPVPYLNVGAIYGYTGNLSLSGNLHVLPILFGDVGFDAGISTSLIKQDKFLPEVTGKAMVMFFTDFRGGVHPRTYPLISVNASYLVGDASLLYVGADNLYQLNAPHYLISPFIGYQFPLGGMWIGQIESKWLAANVNTSHGILEGQTNISDYGNTSVFIGILYSL